MCIILDDSLSWRSMLPLTFARHAADIRCGMVTIARRWARYTGQAPRLFSISPFYPSEISEGGIHVEAALLVNKEGAEQIQALREGEALEWNGRLVAYHHPEIPSLAAAEARKDILTIRPMEGKAFRLSHPIDIFLQNSEWIKEDMGLLSLHDMTDALPSGVLAGGSAGIWAEGACVLRPGVILNSEAGPIILREGAEVMEGAVLRGPVVVGTGSTIKMGAKIYGPTTVGPRCKVGGEVSRSVFQGYANKAHDGFLGDSVIGHWCNLGADTNNSNLSNNYAPVKVWSYVEERFVRTPHQFVGLILGDHSKSAINTMFNTGTVVGFSSNIFGAGFPRKFIPSFSWGGPQGYKTYQLRKAIETAERVMARRNRQLTEHDRRIFERIFEYTQKFRNYNP